MQKKKKLRWFQISLKGLIILLVLISVPVIFLANHARRAIKQREAVASLNDQTTAWYEDRYLYETTGIRYEKSTMLPQAILDWLGKDYIWSIKHIACRTDDSTKLLTLKNFPTLESLNLELENCELGNCLAYLPELKRLRIRANQEFQLPEIKSLELLDLKNPSFPIFQAGCDVNNIKKLALHGSRYQIVHGHWMMQLNPLDKIDNFIHLEKLQCDVDTFGIDLSPLLKFKRLKSLELNLNHSESPIKNLDKFNQLEELRIDNLLSIPPEITKLVNLKRLSLTDVSEIDMKLLENLSQLEEIELSGTYRTKLNTEFLKKLTKLNRIKFNDVIISDLTPFTELKELEQLSFRNTRFHEILSFTKCQKLKRLRFNYCFYHAFYQYTPRKITLIYIKPHHVKTLARSLPEYGKELTHPSLHRVRDFEVSWGHIRRTINLQSLPNFQRTGIRYVAPGSINDIFTTKE